MNTSEISQNQCEVKLYAWLQQWNKSFTNEIHIKDIPFLHAYEEKNYIICNLHVKQKQRRLLRKKRKKIKIEIKHFENDFHRFNYEGSVLA